MVSAARKDREVAERRNEQLRAQLNDTELLLVSHQEQLAELKAVMQQMSSDREEPDINANASTTPSTPASQTHESISKIFDALHLSPSSGSEEISPAPPTSFTHLLHPVLRTDLHSYDDFHALLQMSRKSAPTSRVTSGSYGALNVVGLSSLANREHVHYPNHQPSNGSTSSLSTSASHSSPISSSNSVSANSSVSSRDVPLAISPLKETRFYKRVLAEDIEPTLRLDTAPGLSWLARRTVINSMCEGSLVIEPMPSAPRLYIYSCALCGENRRGDEYARTHRFRTSENENAQRYPLCPYCLNRMRASCEFLGFLRMVKDGHWRTDGAEAESAAWEESVRLRECMFWARIGGGVIPAFMRTRESPRSSVEEEKTSRSAGQGLGLQRQDLENKNPGPRLSLDPFQSDSPSASIGSPSILRRDTRRRANDSWEKSKDAAIFDHHTAAPSNQERAGRKELAFEGQETKSQAISGSESQASTTHQSLASPNDGEQTSSVVIPGAFNF